MWIRGLLGSGRSSPDDDVKTIMLECKCVERVCFLRQLFEPVAQLGRLVVRGLLGGPSRRRMLASDSFLVAWSIGFVIA